MLTARLDQLWLALFLTLISVGLHLIRLGNRLNTPVRSTSWQ